MGSGGMDRIMHDDIIMTDRIEGLIKENNKLSKIITVQSWAIGRLKNLIGHSNPEYAEREAGEIISKVSEEMGKPPKEPREGALTPMWCHQPNSDGPCAGDECHGWDPTEPNGCEYNRPPPPEEPKAGVPKGVDCPICGQPMEHVGHGPNGPKDTDGCCHWVCYCEGVPGQWNWPEGLEPEDDCPNCGATLSTHCPQCGTELVGGYCETCDVGPPEELKPPEDFPYDSSEEPTGGR